MAHRHAGDDEGPLELGATTAPATGKVFPNRLGGSPGLHGDRIAAIDEFHDNYGILVQLGLAGAE